MSNGWAALHYSALMGRLASVKRLLQKGADPSLRSKVGNTALDYARSNGKNEVVALLSEPRYARRQRRASDRLRAARAAARRRGHMRARAVVSICGPAFACRWRTNGGGSPWGLTGSSPRSTTLPMERLDTTHVLPSSCLVAVRVRSAVVGAPGVGGGAAARWPSVAAEVGRAGRPPRTAAPPTAATLPCQRALRALARACLPAMTRRAGHHCTAPTRACARSLRCDTGIGRRRRPRRRPTRRRLRRERQRSVLLLDCPKPNLQPTSPPKSQTDWPPSSIHSHRSHRPRDARTSTPELSHRRFLRASKQRASYAPTSMMMKLRSGEGLRWMRPRDGPCDGRKKWGGKAASR